MKKEKFEWSSILEVMCGIVMVSLAVGYALHESGKEDKEVQRKLSLEEKSGVSAVKPRAHRKHRKKTWIICFCILLLCGSAFHFILGIAQVNGVSMNPNFDNGEILLYNRLDRNIQYGDVIIFQKDNKKYVKRVFGKPGDTVAVSSNGIVLVNHIPLVLDNLYVLGDTEPRDLKGELVLGRDEYFVLGDNRTVSLDSRSKDIGTVTKKEIDGVYLIGIKK